MPIRGNDSEAIPEDVWTFIRCDIPNKMMKMWRSKIWYRKDYSDLLKKVLNSGWVTVEEIVNWILPADKMKMDEKEEKKRKVLESCFRYSVEDEEDARNKILSSEIGSI